MDNYAIKKLLDSLQNDIQKMPENTEEKVKAILRLQEVAKMYSGEDKVVSSTDISEDLKLNPPKPGIMTGFGSLDSILSGFTPQQLIVLAGITKHGKCLTKGTNVLLYDGSIKKVEDIQIGDKLMGVDSSPRFVKNLGRGREEMFEITQGGDTYCVNRSHILSLKRTRTNRYRHDGIPLPNRKGEVINISVAEYLQKKDGFKHIWKGYRVPVNHFGKNPEYLKLDSYFVGLWLGDGDSGTQTITNIEPEIEEYLKALSIKEGKRISIRKDKRSKARRYRICGKDADGNSYLQYLRYYQMLNNKNIPIEYKTGNRTTRLNVLAGIIDTDGSLSKNKWPWYDITQKSDILTSDIVFLARSLGFSVSTHKEKKDIKSSGFSGEYNRIRISGDLSSIPVRVARKKSNYKCTKNILTQAITVKSVGMGEYYGFELDGDGLFLLGNFIVTHNTSFAIELTIRMASENPLWLPFEESAQELIQKFLSRGQEPPLFFTPLQMRQNTLDWIESKIVESKAKYGSKLVFIDHLGFITPRSDSEAQEIGRVMRSLKNMAKKWNIVIVLLCHLNKTSLDKNPDLEDLRGSAAIAQEADTVIFIWRQTTKNRQDGEVEITNNTNISVQANRRVGKTGNVKMTFNNGRYLETDWSRSESDIKADEDFDNNW